MNYLKSLGWILLILIVILSGLFMDYQGNNYEITYKNIEIAVGENKTEHQTILSTPPMVQGYKLFANFLYGLAVTLFVSLFVSLFVARKLEEGQKEKHKKELDKLRASVNINVFDALFKTLIPEEIFQIVKTEIIENKVIRRKAHWTFVFEEVDNQIKMTSTTHYELHNVSKEPVSNPVNIEYNVLLCQDHLTKHSYFTHYATNRNS